MSEELHYENLGKSIIIQKLNKDMKEKLNIFLSNAGDIKDLEIPLLKKKLETLSDQDLSEYINSNQYYFLSQENILIGIFFLNLSTKEIIFGITNSKRNKGYGKAGIHILLKELLKDHPEINQYFFTINKKNMYASLVIYGNNGTLIKENDDTILLSIEKGNNLWVHPIYKEEIPRVMEITNEAKKLLKESGSMQWQTGYPNENSFEEDIKNKALYGLYEDDILVGYGAYILGKDLQYVKIEGKWDIPANDRDMAIHRVAVTESRHGKKYGVKILKYGIQHARNHNCLTVKADTTKINIPMRKSIERSGMTYKGIINVFTDKVDPSRMAFEIVLAQK